MSSIISSLSRRGFLSAASVSAIGVAAQGTATAQAAASATVMDGSDCILTPTVVQGPYYIDPKLIRSDIREDKQGVPMRVRLRVIEAGKCTANGNLLAIPGARVDVWQADARGVYSGYADQGDESNTNTLGQTYLRGTQMTDSNGWVTFESIYPGWYSGRNPHFHFKVFLDQRNVLISEMHFPDALSEFIYGNVPAYTNRHSDRSVININDMYTRLDKQNATFCSIKEERERYLATFIIGVDRQADAVAAAAREAAAPRPGGPPGGPGGIQGNPPNLAGPPHWALRDRLVGLVPGPQRR